MARRAISVPIRPMPRMASVLPYSSTPSKFLRSHLPAFIEASACAMLREMAMSKLNACSAVEIVFPAGVFITTMPAFVAASVSTLSTPTPARPTHLSFLAAAMTFAFTFVCERTTSPSNSPMISSSASSLRPVFTTTSTNPPSRSSATPRSLTGSATKTFGLLII